MIEPMIEIDGATTKWSGEMPDKDIYREVLPWLDRQRAAANTRDQRGRIYDIEDRLCRRVNGGKPLINLPVRWSLHDVERSVDVPSSDATATEHSRGGRKR